jgi:hypothetical protein
MTTKRRFHCGVMLPDGRVLFTGGKNEVTNPRFVCSVCYVIFESLTLQDFANFQCCGKCMGCGDSDDGSTQRCSLLVFGKSVACFGGWWSSKQHK